MIECSIVSEKKEKSIKMAKMAQIGQNFQKLFFHSLSAPICAGLPQFEEKIQRNKKVMAQSCQDNDISGAP